MSERVGVGEILCCHQQHDMGLKECHKYALSDDNMGLKMMYSIPLKCMAM